MRSRRFRQCAILLVTLSGSVSLPAQSDPPIYVVPIHGEINPARVVFVRRSIQAATEVGARMIIFDIDTFGGRVDSALQITTLIGSAQPETIAYVSLTAEGTGVSWSAGALISFACEEIYMAPGTSIGAAAPVYQTQTGMELADEKTVSAVRTQMAALAEKNGYPMAVALAMVDMDVELLEVFLGDERRLAARSDLVDLERTAAEMEVGLEEGRVVSASGKLLTLTAGEMERFEISAGTVASVEELLEHAGEAGAELVALEESLADRAAAFVTGAAISGILILAGLVALYLEITTPSFGLPGTAAIICFSIVFIGGALLGNVGSLELLIFLAGIILLVIEIFLIPGFGVTGVAGIAFIAASLVLSRQGFVWPEFEWEWDLLRRNLAVVGVSVVGSLAVFALLLSVFPRIPLFNRLILASSRGPGSAAAGVGSALSASSSLQRDYVSSELLGRDGVASTPLRPVGKAAIDGEIYEVASEGEFLESGTAIRVVDARGNRLLVAKRDTP